MELPASQSNDSFHMRMVEAGVVTEKRSFYPYQQGDGTWRASYDWNNLTSGSSYVVSVMRRVYDMYDGKWVVVKEVTTGELLSL